MIEKLLVNYPLPTGVVFAYGTAGFRTKGALLPPVAFRLGFVASLLSAVNNGKCVGVMITASHNAHEDNGIKMVDVDGGMLSRSWEPFATSVANSKTGVEILAHIEQFLKTVPAFTAVDGMVHVARDTRPSGAAMSEALRQSLALVGCTVVDHGIMTTPQLHSMVYFQNILGNPAPREADYFSRLVSSFANLLESESSFTQRIVVDCANGVGSLALQGLQAALSERGASSQQVELRLVNTNITDELALNDNCGADYVQKSKVPPQVFLDHFREDPTTLFFSVDGDADRVVAFHFEETSEGLVPVLLDGDRIAILLATLVGSILRDECLEPGALDVGIVQTAYANGSSTRYVHDTLNLRTYCAATGVKYLHPIAHERDIGIYFEANGHGTILFNKERVFQSLPRTGKAAQLMENLATILSQCCGDAVGDLLAVVVALRRLKWTSAEWLQMYTDLHSSQSKVIVPNPKVITNTPDETRALSPTGLQEAIDAAVRSCGDAFGRAFVRPSGTEPIVRVYVEASSTAAVASLRASIEAIVATYCK